MDEMKLEIRVIIRGCGSKGGLSEVKSLNSRFIEGNEVVKVYKRGWGREDGLLNEVGPKKKCIRRSIVKKEIYYREISVNT